jgi:hypothetical protein
VNGLAEDGGLTEVSVARRRDADALGRKAEGEIFAQESEDAASGICRRLETRCGWVRHHERYAFQMIPDSAIGDFAVWEWLVGLLLLVGLPALEFYAWDAAIWWHGDKPKDPRNGL